jgi:hypothetical protein
VTASLIVAGFETYDNSIYRPVQLSGLGWIPGDPLPDQATVEQKYLDGEAVTGDRTRNRSVRIPVWVSGLSALDLAANVNALWQAVTADTFTLQWTPNGGLPVIYDCYHATVTKPNNTYLADQFTVAVMIECQAKPFGRSPDVQSVTVQSTLQIDSFDTAPTGGTLNTTLKAEGTGSSTFTAGTPVSRSFAAKNLSAFSQATVQMYLAGGLPFGGLGVNLTLQLTSAGGSTSFTASGHVNFASQWTLLAIPLSGGTVVSGAGVSLAAVTSYSLTVTFSGGAAATRLIDDLRAGGSGSTIIGPTTHAAVVSVPVSVGAARTPANLTLAPASGTLTAFVLHSPPITQDPNAAILSSLSTASTNQTITVAALNSAFRSRSHRKRTARQSVSRRHSRRPTTPARVLSRSVRSRCRSTTCQATTPRRPTRCRCRSPGPSGTRK